MSNLLLQALHEITDKPLAFAAEVVQFGLLVLIVVVLFRRVVGKMLAERRRGIADWIERANAAPQVHIEAEKRAAALVAEARAQAQRVAEGAAAAAADVRREGLAKIEADASATVHQAEQAIEVEKSRAAREASERLVDLIGVVVRRFLEEAFTESERRTATQKLILDRLKGLSG